MKIEILGLGCPKCEQLAKNTRQALAKLNIKGGVEKVQDLQRIMSYGPLTTPALAIDGQVKSTGRLLNVEQIVELLSREAN